MSVMKNKELHRRQRADQVNLVLQDAHEVRESEAVVRCVELEQNASFNNAFLGILEGLIQAIAERK